MKKKKFFNKLTYFKVFLIKKQNFDNWFLYHRNLYLISNCYSFTLVINNKTCIICRHFIIYLCNLPVSIFWTLLTNGRFSAFALKPAWFRSQQRFLATMHAWQVLIRTKPVVGCHGCLCSRSCGEVQHLLLIKICD